MVRKFLETDLARVVSSLPTDEEKSEGSRNMVLQKDIENSMNWTTNQRGSLKSNNRKNTSPQNQ